MATSQNFRGGAYAGMTTSQIDGDGLGGFDLPGFHIGGFVFVPVGEKSQIQMELAFIQKGSRRTLDDTTDGFSYFYKARLNYIEIPLLYQLRYKDLSFEAGPALDILTTSKEEYDFIETESDPPFTRFSLSGILGVNWHFAEKWFVGFRSSVSLTQIRKGQAAPNQPNVIAGGYGQRNVVLSFAVNHIF